MADIQICQQGINRRKIIKKYRNAFQFQSFKRLEANQFVFHTLSSVRSPYNGLLTKLDISELRRKRELVTLRVRNIPMGSEVFNDYMEAHKFEFEYLFIFLLLLPLG